MKINFKTVAAAALILTTAAPVAALTDAELRQKIQRAAGPNSNVSISINGDTLTVYGFVQDVYSRNRVSRAVQSGDYTDIRNSVVQTN